MTTEYNKLVRDKIPEIIAKEGKTVVFTCMPHWANEDIVQARQELNNKLWEEVQELSEVITPHECFPSTERTNKIKEEIGDVICVLHAIMQSFDISLEEVSESEAAKTEAKGTFKNLTYLKYVEERY